MKQQLKPNENGTPAERAADLWIHLFSVMQHEGKMPVLLADETKEQIVGVFDDIIEAAVDAAVEKFVKIQSVMDGIGKFLN